MTRVTPRIYVASLSDYNNGILHGRWIDCIDVDQIQTEIAEMLRSSHYPNVEVEHPDTGEMVPSAEEWAIHDVEGLPFKGEHIDLDKIVEYAEAIDDMDESEVEAFDAFIDNGCSNEVDVDAFRDAYQGCWDSLADYAENWFEDTGSIPKDLPPIIANNIDWKGIGEELRIGGDIWYHDGSHGLHVFYNH